MKILTNIAFISMFILTAVGCSPGKAQPRIPTVEFIADFVFEDSEYWYILEFGQDDFVVWSDDPEWGRYRRYGTITDFVSDLDEELVARGDTPYVVVDQWGKIIVIDWTYRGSQ